MRLSVILSLLPLVAAHPGRKPCHHHDVKPWKPAGRHDSRSPCPLLNTLANHGYLPHHGRNLTVQDFGDALQQGVGWSPETGLIPAANAFEKLGSPPTIDLQDLDNRELGFEHPGSLARADDSNNVVPARVRAVLDDSDNPLYLTPASLALTRNRLEVESELSESEQITALGEAMFVMGLMLDGTVPDAGIEGIDYASTKAVKAWTREWLTLERLPVKLGWRPSKREVTFADLGPFREAIAAAKADVN